MAYLVENPLAILFGRVLRQLRTEQSRSSREVARSLPISESAYRLIEAGGAIFNPVHTPALIRVFGSLVWLRLLAFLACIEASEFARRRGGDYWGTALSVSALDESLNMLIRDHLSGMPQRSQSDGTETASRASTPYVIATRTYLEDRTGNPAPKSAAQPLITLSEWASRAPGDISPIQLDMLLQEIETLQHFPPNVPPKQISLWEARNAAAISNVYAFVDDLAVVSEVAEQFHWDYLFVPRFGQVHILTSRSAGFVEARDRLLRNIAQAKGGERKLARVSGKVQIVEIADAPLEEIKQHLRYNDWEGRLGREDDEASQIIELKNVWLYQLRRNNLTVGFADSWTASVKAEAPSMPNSVPPRISATLSKAEVSMLLPHLTGPWKE